MKLATYSGAFKLFPLWLLVASMAFSVYAKTDTDELFVSEDILAYGFSMSSLQGNKDVDPNKVIKLATVGIGTRLTKVELIDNNGKVIFTAQNQDSLSLPAPLAFGTRHTLKVTAERPWTGQSETREINFTTVAMPKLEGPTNRVLEPDASVTLHFDRPVANVKATSALKVSTELDSTGQSIRLLANEFQQDHSYPVQLSFKTHNGIAMPPINLTLSSVPPLSMKTNVHGLSNVGLALPLKITFSESLANKNNASQFIQVQDQESRPISGKWSWNSARQLVFTPQPAWPASSTIKVSMDNKNISSERGGTMKESAIDEFSTGTDRKLVVYLDSQRVEAIENGKVIRTFMVSTGKNKTPTVVGSYYIYDRYRKKTMRSDAERGQPGYYEVKDVPYTQFFYKDYAFHGAFWHNNFGHPASHGCVNMATKEQNKRWPNAAEDAGWLYQWGALGLPVTVMKKAPDTVQASQESAKDKETKSAKIETNAKTGDIVVR